MTALKIFILLIVGLITIGAGWYYKDALQVVVDTLISPYKPFFVKSVVSPDSIPPPEWESISVPSYGLSLRVPPGSIVDQEAAQLKLASGKDFITISANSGLLVPAIFNQDLFKKVYDLKVGDEFIYEHLNEEIRFTKIESGKILSGQQYTTFVWDHNSIQLGSHKVEVRAFILKGTTLIIFTLNSPIDEDTEFFKKIVRFSNLN